jgi:hypothetical protein
VHAQLPDLHVLPATHAWPQVPQFFESLCVLEHVLVPAQYTRVDEAHWQFEPEQISAEGHVLPHAPQLLGLLPRSTQAAPQSVGVLPMQPVTHIELTPKPEHWGAVGGQTCPHVPQLAGWVTSVSQPALGAVVQCAHPSAHDDGGTEHTPALHVVCPATCGFIVQSLPHVPQFFWSVCRSVHAPEHVSFAEGGQEHPPPPIVHT